MLAKQPYLYQNFLANILPALTHFFKRILSVDNLIIAFDNLIEFLTGTKSSFIIYNCVSTSWNICGYDWSSTR